MSSQSSPPFAFARRDSDESTCQEYHAGERLVLPPDPLLHLGVRGGRERH
jgi:hypothetical protein